MVKYSNQVYAYIPPEMKTRLRRIKAADRDRSESSLVEKGLELIIPQIEKELGISQPAQRPRSRKAV